jgi:hypothetical protein
MLSTGLHLTSESTITPCGCVVSDFSAVFCFVLAAPGSTKRRWTLTDSAGVAVLFSLLRISIRWP